MRSSTFLSLAASVATASAQYKGFNYGSTNTDNSAVTESEFESLFTTAQGLDGTSGWTAARLYTMIQADSTDTPITAISAAISTNTKLLLGLWASGAEADFENEIAALTSAISTYGSSFADLVIGISVGSEDLYRISPTGIENDSGVGAEPSTIVSYISSVRSAIANTVLSAAPVGHVDTWNAWVNSSNDAVISASDFLGVDAYPYYETTLSNSIDNGASLFSSAYEQTVSAANGKDVWVTETGWPISGSSSGDAVASVANAQTYWDDVGCDLLFGKVNTFWYTLRDAYPTTPSPSFGIVGATLSDTPLYNLTCPAGTGSSSSSSSSSSTAASSTASSKVATSSAATSTVDAKVATSSAVVSSAASSASVASSTKTVVTTSAETIGTSASVSGGQTLTVYETTLITITSCSNGCSSTASVATSAETSAPVVVSSAKASTTSATSAAVVSSAKASTTTATSAAVVSSAKASTTATSAAVVSSAKVSTTSATSSAASASASSCAANLDGTYISPNLITPISSTQPDKAFGTQYNGTITSTVSTIFSFDIPESFSGKTCSFVFLFPELADLETSSYSFNGEGGIVSHVLNGTVDSATDYANAPAFLVEDGAVTSVASGNSYVISSDKCPPGTQTNFEVSSTGGLSLEFFEDYNPSPLGFYVVAC